MKTYNNRLWTILAVSKFRCRQYTCGNTKGASCFVDGHSKLPDIFRLAICKNLSKNEGNVLGDQTKHATESPLVMLCRRSCGFFVANSRTSFVFSGGTCLRIICPGGTVQSSSGNRAPDPTCNWSEAENIKDKLIPQHKYFREIVADG